MSSESEVEASRIRCVDIRCIDMKNCRTATLPRHTARAMNRYRV
jgi:hypothetical protein